MNNSAKKTELKIDTIIVFWYRLKFFDKDYRSIVGAMFIMAAVDDPRLTPKDPLKAMKQILKE